jgi:hypothetical protein
MANARPWLAPRTPTPPIPCAPCGETVYSRWRSGRRRPAGPDDGDDCGAQHTGSVCVPFYELSLSLSLCVCVCVNAQTCRKASCRGIKNNERRKGHEGPSWRSGQETGRFSSPIWPVPRLGTQLLTFASPWRLVLEAVPGAPPWKSGDASRRQHVVWIVM